MRNQTGAADRVAANPVADIHQIIDRRGDIENRDRLVVYCMLAGTQPEDPLRMMARALDGIDRIKQVKKIKQFGYRCRKGVLRRRSPLRALIV